MKVVVLLSLILSSAVIGSPSVPIRCHWDDEFPCDDGTCIDKTVWCDSEIDCPDASDEKYCARRTASSPDPNNCTETHYFKCKDGPCIPVEGLCDGYFSCLDSSDEANCNVKTEYVTPTIRAEHAVSATTENEESDNSPETTERTTVVTPYSTTIQTNSSLFEKQQNDAIQRPVFMWPPTKRITPYPSAYAIPIQREDTFTILNPKAFSDERSMAQAWILSERDENFGWKGDTSRALVALFLSNDPGLAGKTESTMLMIKQLHLQLSLAIMRNTSKPIPLSDLSLYINALMAVCSNPRDFHGLDLIAVLRQRTNAAQSTGKFVSPLVYLTLCARNSTTFEDVKKIQEIFTSRTPAMDRLDVQSLATLAASCIAKTSKYAKSLSLQDFGRRLLSRISSEGLPANVYELPLLVQAMNEARVAENLWDRSKAMALIRKHQNSNGSFGDVLATYYVLPLLSGKSLVSLKDSCSNSEDGFTPLDILKNTGRERIYVRYSLYMGNPVDVSQTLQLNVAKGTHFLDIMRLAEEVNPNFKFQFNYSRGIPKVFSIGGVVNDAEKGLYWILHVSSRNATTDNILNLVPYNNDLRQHIPEPGDHTVFWMKSLA